MKDLSSNANNSLNKAKIAQRNEFFTRSIDVENEIFCGHVYEGCFNGKTVLCNCNDAERSGFERVFINHFFALGLSELITVSYNPSGTGKIMRFNGNKKVYVQLKGTGDYKSPECIDLLEQSDIVCTNPPFSCFRSFIQTLIEYGKRFLIIGNVGEMLYSDMFPLFANDEIWYGNNQVKKFNTSDGECKFGNIGWYTNMGERMFPEPVKMSCSYQNDPEEYPRYDNYNAIDVKYLKDIPYDYYGIMGVPGTYLLVYNPNQFELIGTNETLAGPIVSESGKTTERPGAFYVNGKKIYVRVAIRRRH